MSLSDEDRRRIEDEEEYRAEVRVRAEAKARESFRSEERAKRVLVRPSIAIAFSAVLGFVLISMIIVSVLPRYRGDNGEGTTSRNLDAVSSWSDEELRAQVSQGRMTTEQMFDAWNRGDTGSQYQTARWGSYCSRLGPPLTYKYITAAGWTSTKGGWTPNKVSLRYAITSTSNLGAQVSGLYNVALIRTPATGWRVAYFGEHSPEIPVLPPTE